MFIEKVEILQASCTNKNKFSLSNIVEVKMDHYVINDATQEETSLRMKHIQVKWNKFKNYKQTNFEEQKFIDGLLLIKLKIMHPIIEIKKYCLLVYHEIGLL